MVRALAAATVVASTALVGSPFLRTGAGRRAFRALGGRATRRGVVGAYAGFVALYATVVLAVAAVGAAAAVGPLDRTLALCWPFSLGVAAVTVWLPATGTEWRAADRRVEDTLAWAAFVGVLTAAAVAGVLLLGG